MSLAVVLLLPGLAGPGIDCPKQARPACSAGGCITAVAVAGHIRPHNCRVHSHSRVPVLCRPLFPCCSGPVCCTLSVAPYCMTGVAPAYNVALGEVGVVAGMLVAQAVAGTPVAHSKLLEKVDLLIHSSNSAPPPATP